MIRSKNGLSLDCSNIVLLTALQGIENRTVEESYTYLCLGPCQQLIAVTRMQVREDDINIFRQLDVTLPRAAWGEDVLDRPKLV